MRGFTRRLVGSFVAGLIVVTMAVLPASAGSGAGGETQRGGCIGGRGEWRLSVDRRDSGRLRVRFRIDDVREGQAWQIFLSDNGVRIFSGTRRADSGGSVRVTKITRNRAGSDRIAASGVNSVTGATCGGSLTF